MDEALCYGWIDEIKLFKASPTALAHFEKLAPSYRHKALHRVTSAAKPETRRSRLERVIAMCAAGKKF